MTTGLSAAFLRPSGIVQHRSRRGINTFEREEREEKRQFLKRPSTAQGGSAGSFTIALTTHTHARARARTHLGRGDRHGCEKEFRNSY